MHPQLKFYLEAVLFTASEPQPFERLLKAVTVLEDVENKISAADVKLALQELTNDYATRSIELREIASGYCFRVRHDYGKIMAQASEENPPKYSRAFLETLAIIAYRQPVTRAEIEEIRGVGVHSNIIKTLIDHGWVRIAGQREVPGRPSLLVTTREFLDHFNLATLQDLPQLEKPLPVQESVFEEVEETNINIM